MNVQLRTAVIGLLSVAFLAQPGAPDPRVRGQVGDGVIRVLAERNVQGGAANLGGVAGVFRATLIVPACPGNEPTHLAPLDALCVSAISMCASTPEPRDLLVWVFRGPAGVARPTLSQWVLTATRCMSTQPAASPGPRPAFTLRDFRRLPLPPGGVNVQPPNLRTLVNVPTNVFVSAAVTRLDTTLLGLPVRVRATPVRFHWTFGDGRSLVTEDPGAAYPDLRTTHTYSQPGTRQLGLTTTYTGEYSVAGGPWVPIDGVAQVVSAPVTLTVLAAESQLIGAPAG